MKKSVCTDMNEPAMLRSEASFQCFQRGRKSMLTDHSSTLRQDGDAIAGSGQTGLQIRHLQVHLAALALGVHQVNPGTPASEELAVVGLWTESADWSVFVICS